MKKIVEISLFITAVAIMAAIIGLDHFMAMDGHTDVNRPVANTGAKVTRMENIEIEGQIKPFFPPCNQGGDKKVAFTVSNHWFYGESEALLIEVTPSTDFNELERALTDESPRFVSTDMNGDRVVEIGEGRMSHGRLHACVITDSDADGRIEVTLPNDADGTHDLMLATLDYDFAPFGLPQVILEMPGQEKAYTHCNWWNERTRSTLNVDEPFCTQRVIVKKGVAHKGGNMGNFNG